MKICEIESYFQSIYPKERACSWDNDGLLLCSDRDREVNRIVTCLDVTFSVIECAIEKKCQLIVSHHPLIFSPISSITEDSLLGQKILLLMESKISVLSLHTRFDGAIGGLNELFGKKLGIFPEYHAPLLATEPYIGAIGSLAEKVSPDEFAKHISMELKSPVKLFSAHMDISRVGYCCGSGKDLVFPSLRAGADAFVGGDIPYHIAQEAVEKGMTVIDCGHHASEKDAAHHFRAALLSLSTDFEIFAVTEYLGGEIVDFS